MILKNIGCGQISRLYYTILASALSEILKFCNIINDRCLIKHVVYF